MPAANMNRPLDAREIRRPASTWRIGSVRAGRGGRRQSAEPKPPSPSTWPTGCARPMPRADDRALGWRSFAGGAAAGVLDTCVTMPLDTVKTKMQIQRYGSLASCVRTIVRADGVAGLYYGFKPFMLQASGKAAIRFLAYDMICQAVDATGVDRAARPTLWSSTCGLIAGMCEATLWTAPTERLKILRQARAGEGRGKPPSFAAMLREQGVGGLYVGATATVARQATSVAVRFTLFDRVKSATCASFGYDPRAAPTWVLLISGGIGGVMSAVFNNPIDVVKSRIQSRSGPAGGLSMAQCLRETVAEGGLRALGGGLQARAFRLFLSQGIQFSVVDRVGRLLR